MTKKRKKDDRVKIFGVKIDGGVFVAIIISTLVLIYSGYIDYKLEYGKTEIVFAEIIEVGIKRQGRSTTGYIHFRYFLDGKEVIRSVSSFSIKDNFDNIHVGDCIEVLISLEDRNLFRWNESRGTFKCD